MHTSRHPAGQSLCAPAALRLEFPLDAETSKSVARSRLAVQAILDGSDHRLLVIAGPCSVHEREGALEYARFVAEQNRLYGDKLLVLMRCYVEKSRTALGWKGMARDPLYSGGPSAPEGVRRSRELICAIAALGVPVAVEMVSPFLWPFWIDAVSWVAVGARGVESQALREAAAALPCPCGFKNGQDGALDPALFAISYAKTPSAVIVPGDSGGLEEIQAAGNPLPHMVLRGATRGPNWKAAPALIARMEREGLVPAVIVDASHGNSGKNPENQVKVARALCRMRKKTPIRGIMLESFLHDGAQALYPGKLPLAGLSVTDPCLGLEKTRSLLRYLAENA